MDKNYQNISLKMSDYGINFEEQRLIRLEFITLNSMNKPVLIYSSMDIRQNNSIKLEK